MITGITNHYNNENAFEDFIRLVSNANLTLRRISKEDDKGIKQVLDEINFNYIDSFESYRNLIDEKLDALKSEIKYDTIFQQTKFEKHLYISEKILQLQNAVSKLSKAEGKFQHADFKFSNISIEGGDVIQLNEDSIQNYYSHMYHSGVNALDYLTLIKEAVVSSSNADFPILKTKEQDNNEPSMAKPLAFFEYFFVFNGFSQFHRNFYPSNDEDYYNIASIDTENEVITFTDYDPEEGYYTYKKDFKSNLQERLYKEFLKAKRFTDEHINSLHKIDEVQLFLTKLLYQFKFIHKRLQQSKAAKYEVCTQFIIEFIQYLFDKYEPFVKEHSKSEFFSSIIDEPIVKQERTMLSLPLQSLPKKKSNVYGFKWTTDTLERTTKLYYLLTENNIIPDNIELMLFSKAFEGGILEEPLSIPWLKTVKGKLSKPLILSMFDYLIEMQLLERVNSEAELYKKIQRIFVDQKGKPLEYFNISHHGSLKRKGGYTIQEKEIIALLRTLVE